MALETGTYISDLVATNPTSGDPVSQADDHIRLVKSTVKASFPAVAGAVTATHTELNALDGITPIATSAIRTAAGMLVDRAYGEYLANVNLTTIIPLDDTIPQNTEGTQIISVSFTPKSATNRVRLRFQGGFSLSQASNGSAAVFSSASASALSACTQAVTSADLSASLVCEHEYVPATVSALTFTVRVGPTAGTMRMNGTPGFGRTFGGASKVTLVIEEFSV